MMPDKKKASSLFPEKKSRRFLINHQGLIVVAALILESIVNGFNDAKGHSGTDDIQGIPQPPHKYHMVHIPDLFKTKGKHYILLLD